METDRRHGMVQQDPVEINDASCSKTTRRRSDDSPLRPTDRIRSFNLNYARCSSPKIVGFPAIRHWLEIALGL